MPIDSKVGRRHWGWLILLVTFWKFQHFNLISKIFQKLFKPLPCHKSIGKMMHAICISAVAVSLRWASCGPWASCLLSVQLFLKILSGMANCIDPDQTSIWSGSTLFAYKILSDALVYDILRYLLYKKITFESQFIQWKIMTKKLSVTIKFLSLCCCNCHCSHIPRTPIFYLICWALNWRFGLSKFCLCVRCHYKWFCSYGVHSILC